MQPNIQPLRKVPHTSNALVAGGLGAFVLGTYWYTMSAVGQDDLSKEISREAAKMAREEAQSQGK